ncbi:S41 family peptidase [Thalassoglobus sp. JC818]|uniref:S41 family peptidase n=1 Tax=Thalassoglobus sp. JC818 TaxID=3232136 RepID=UPI003459B4AC
MNHRLESFTWAATSALLTAAIFLTTVSSQGMAHAQSEDNDSAQAESDEDYYELMRVFVDTFQQIDRNYVKEVDRRELVDAAVRGMLSELDPYSNYISPDDVERFTEAITQEFGGVGIRVGFDDEMRAIEITTPIPGSPAYRAGIKSGDRIVEIDGEAVRDFPKNREMDRAVELLRGLPGESVEVAVRRASSGEVEKMTLTRELIQLDTVMGNTYNDDGSWNFMFDDELKIGYARLTHFTSRSAGELREALKTLRKEDMKGFILDLRFNPGGQLQSAIDISDLFIEEGRIVSTEGRNSRPRSWSAKRFGTFTGFPMAILINRYSASASEIVSACLQDHDRAVVIGERSWGKGSVQNVIELEEGNSQLKLTTASYHRPSGKNIHRFPNAKESDEWGVMPNDGYLVKFSMEEMTKYQEDRRDRDIVDPQDPVESTFEDTQLEKAIEYLKAELGVEPEETQENAEEKAASGSEEESEEAADEAEVSLRNLFYQHPKQLAG